MVEIVLLLVAAAWIAIVMIWRRNRNAPDDQRPLTDQLHGLSRGAQLRVLVRWATGL
jgi:hypothetical protein